MRHSKPGTGLVILLLVLFWPMAAGTFDDCAAGDYLAEVDPRVIGTS